MGTSEDIQIVKRLLRDVFSDLVSLKDRLKSIEEKEEENQSKRQDGRFGAGNLTAEVDFCTGLEQRSNQLAGPISEDIVPVSPRAALNFNFPFNNMGGGLKAVITAKGPDFVAMLDKVVCKWESIKGNFRVIFSPLGARGDDLIPTLNPTAEQGLSRGTRKGCPIHQAFNGPALGLDMGTEKGNRLITAIFMAQEQPGLVRSSVISEIILAPTKNVTFGLVGSNSMRFKAQNGEMAHASVGHASSHEASHDSTHSQSTVDLSDFQYGAVGALNFDEDVLLSGWVSCSKRPNSWGVCLSSFPYPNTVSTALGLYASKKRGGSWQHTLEFSAKMPCNGGMELHPGIVANIHNGKFSAFAGLRSVWKF